MQTFVNISFSSLSENPSMFWTLFIANISSLAIWIFISSCTLGTQYFRFNFTVFGEISAKLDLHSFIILKTFFPNVDRPSNSKKLDRNLVVNFLLLVMHFANFIYRLQREVFRCIVFESGSIKYLCVCLSNFKIFLIATFQLL